MFDPTTTSFDVSMAVYDFEYLFAYQTISLKIDDEVARKSSYHDD